MVNNVGPISTLGSHRDWNSDTIDTTSTNNLYNNYGVDKKIDNIGLPSISGLDVNRSQTKHEAQWPIGLPVM